MTSRRRFLCAAAVAVGAAGTTGCTSLALTEGETYARIEPAQPVASGDRIEVIEFFWYGCPHCHDMHPRLEAWSRRLPADVALRREAAALRPTWESGARMHFVLEALGESGRLAGPLFEAVQLDGLDLQDEGAWFAWAAAKGLDRQRVIDMTRSPQAQRYVALSSEFGPRYQLRGVPAFVVDGRFLTSNSFTGSAQDTLDTVDKLVAKARAERAAQHKAR